MFFLIQKCQKYEYTHTFWYVKTVYTKTHFFAHLWFLTIRKSVKTQKTSKNDQKNVFFLIFPKKRVLIFSCYFLKKAQKMDISLKTAKIEKPL